MEKAAARVMKANRAQIEMRSVDLEGLLPADHQARAVWAFVERIDLAPLYDQVEAVEGEAGRPAIDPAILVALWLYATLEGVGSARALERLCEEHNAYRWIRGGVGVNYHTLADFRVAHGEVLEKLLTGSVAALLASGAMRMNRVAQDGVRVRANAGASSFRRRPKLERFLAEAQAQVAALKQELDTDPGASNRRQQAAQERAARERKERVGRALTELQKIEAHRAKAESPKRGAAPDGGAGPAQGQQPPGPTPPAGGGEPSQQPEQAKQKRRAEPRASTTDPEARVMKGPAGGFRPSYNLQFATDVETQIVVGVAVVNDGTDQGQLEPMLEQLHKRYGRCPPEMLVDGGFATVAGINAAAAVNSRVYAPVKPPKNPLNDPYRPRRSDSQAVAEWRARMATPEAKEIYKQRAATAECVNAQARNHGLRQFPVRSLVKAKAIALWHALAHNLQRMVSLELTPALAT
jgi:transposase